MIVVGCPVYERGWVLRRWAAPLIEFSKKHAVRFVFVYTPSKDDTMEVIQDIEDVAPVNVIFYDEGVHGEDRDWANPDRIETLATMRNLILDKAADLGCDYYLSIDSDIVATEPRHLLAHVAGFSPGKFDAVSPIVMLGPDRNLINTFSQSSNGRLMRSKRPNLGFHTDQGAIEATSVDVLCAAKLMRGGLAADTRVRYAYHPQGEDFAWSIAAKKEGYQLGACSMEWEHIMNKKLVQ